MKFFGIFLIVLGIACFFMPFLLPTPVKQAKPVQKGFESVTQTELGSVYPLMGVSSIATGLALAFAAVITNEKLRKGR